MSIDPRYADWQARQTHHVTRAVELLAEAEKVLAAPEEVFNRTGLGPAQLYVEMAKLHLAIRALRKAEAL